MAYYGIVFHDEDELLHYGVKGMKWGKKVFGKVKGVFGKGRSVAGKAKNVLTAKGDLQKSLAKTALKTELHGNQTANVSKPSSSPVKPKTIPSPGKEENGGNRPKKRYKKGVMVVEDGYVGNTHYVKTEYSNKVPVGKKYLLNLITGLLSSQQIQFGRRTHLIMVVTDIHGAIRIQNGVQTKRKPDRRSKCLQAKLV